MTQCSYLHRRFLRARKYDLAHAKKMFKDCQHWRKTVSGVGIDELYRRTDPFDVRSSPIHTFLIRGLMLFASSIPSVKLSSNVGLCGSIKYVSFSNYFCSLYNLPTNCFHQTDKVSVQIMIIVYIRESLSCSSFKLCTSKAGL